MQQDDLDHYKEYSLRITILRSAKESAEDLKNLVEIDHKIKILEEDQSELALRMFEEGQV